MIRAACEIQIGCELAETLVKHGLSGTLRHKYHKNFYNNYFYTYIGRYIARIHAYTHIEIF